MKHFISITTVLVVSLITYAVTLRGIPGNIPAEQIKGTYDQMLQPLELSPERGRFTLTKSLAQDGSFSLSQTLADAAFPDVGVYNGKYYVFFAPGISLWALPFYSIGAQYNLAQVATFFSVTIFALANIVLVYVISIRMFQTRKSAASMAALTFGTASCAVSYATTLYQHQATTFLILSSLLAVWSFKQAHKAKFIYASWVWIAYALGIWIDYPNAILMLPVMVYFLFSTLSIRKVDSTTSSIQVKLSLTSVISSLLFVTLVGLHGWYNYVHFDSPTRLSGQLVGYKQLVEDVESTNNIAALQAEKQASRFFTEEAIPFGLYTLTVAPDKGLFIFAPIFILALAGIYTILKQPTTERIVLISIAIVHIFLYASWGDPWGGWAFGPRYLIPTTAVGAILIGYLLHVYARNLTLKALTFVLYCASVFISLLGAFTTNAVPPAVEARALNMSYGIQYVWGIFNEGRTGSFLFNSYLIQLTTLQNVFLIIWGACALVALVTLLTPLITLPSFRLNKQAKTVRSSEVDQTTVSIAIKQDVSSAEGVLW